MKTYLEVLCIFLLGVSLPASADTTVKITGNDAMKYNKAKFSVKSGEKVTLNFSHVGKLPKQAMGHNVVILKAGVDVDKFARDAAASPKNGYIPKRTGSQILARTKILGGGESDTIVFTAPAPGTYVFICSFPGHYAMMKGVMRVK